MPSVWLVTQDMKNEEQEEVLQKGSTYYCTIAWLQDSTNTIYFLLMIISKALNESNEELLDITSTSCFLLLGSYWV